MLRIRPLVSLLAITLFLCSTAEAQVAATRTAAHPSIHSSNHPEVRSNAALVIDTSNSSILFARNANAPRPIASLTKLMTALVVVESSQSLEDVIVMTQEDRDGTRGAASRLTVGAKLTRGDLLHLALMASDNRAAYALARTYPGGKAAALRAMNAKALALGMTNSKFTDPSGLSSGNVASATDISKLMLAVANHETIRSYSTSSNYSVMFAKQAVQFRNTNYLVAKPDWDIEVQKTGYTSEAGQCLAMKTIIQGRSMVIVLLDSFGKHTRTADARRIRKWIEAREAPRIARTAG